MAVVYATPQEVSEYTGIPLANLPSDIDRLISRAMDIIDYYVLDKIRLNYVNDNDVIEPERVRNFVMLATCAEVEYYINFGEQTEAFLNGDISSFAVGNFNMNFGSNGSASIPKISNRSRRYLFLAGLTYRGVNIK